MKFDLISVVCILPSIVLLASWSSPSFVEVGAFSVVNTVAVRGPPKGKAKAPTNLAASKKAATKKVAVAATKQAKPLATNGKKKKPEVSAKKTAVKAAAKKKPVASAKKTVVKAVAKKKTAVSAKKTAVKAAAKKKPIVKKKSPVKAAAKKLPAKKQVKKKVAPKRKIAVVKLDPSLAITKTQARRNKIALFKQKKNAKKPAPTKAASSIFAFSNDDKKKKIVLKTTVDTGAVNPLQFGIKVINSDKGKEATSILVEGGLKLVSAILDEGKKTKVVVPTRNKNTGKLADPTSKYVGPKEILGAGVFAGPLALDAARSAFDRLYSEEYSPRRNGNKDNGTTKPQVKIIPIEAKVNKKTGKVIRPAQEKFTAKIGGKTVVVSRNR